MSEQLLPTECPRCSFELQPPAESCPRCGVIIAKFSLAPRKIVPSMVKVSTGDLKCDYEVLRPVFFSVCNKHAFSSQLRKLATKYGVDAKDPSGHAADFLYLFLGEWPVGHQDFPVAFAVCIEELKRQAIALGGDAVVWLRQDIDLDTLGFQFFYMQVYGTAVKMRAQ